jgi:plasmid stabilization system protein ParE
MAGWRELTFAPLPYIVAYRITPNAIEIARVFHGAQDWL